MGYASYQEMRQGMFIIKYHLETEKTALEVQKLVDAANAQLEEFFQIQLSRPVLLWIADSNAEFFHLAMGTLPEWSAAVFIPRTRTIIIKKPALLDSPIDWRESVIHELTHLYVLEKFRSQKIPQWYNEGLAEYLSGKRIDLPDAIRLSNAMWAKRIIPLTAIDSLNFFPEKKAQLAYLQSLSATIYLKNLLEDPLKWQRFNELVAEEGWEKALRFYLKMDSIDFEIKWYRFLQEKYRWLIILNIENLLWVMAIFILIFSLYAIRHRNKKRLQEWETEAEYTPYSYSDTYPFQTDENFKYLNDEDA